MTHFNFKNFILTFVIILSGFGCGQSNNNTSARNSTSTKVKIDSTDENRHNWYDDLLINYIHHSANELINQSIKNNIPESWLFDRIELTDSAKYFVFQVGHDVSDSGYINLRYVTDSWIYIDSLKNNVYEYNLASNKLVVWKAR